jgi:esterase/lipase
MCILYLTHCADNSKFMVPNYSKLFLDPQIQYPSPNGQLDYAEYIDACKLLIERTRLDLAKQPEKIINANAPFELRPHPPSNNQKIKTGALLIHGLLDSPLTMRDIGTELYVEGILVRSVLLPGHGTVPGALLNINYQEWIQTIEQAVSALANEVEQIYLVGFSTGASLALHHATHFPANIAGIISIAPALKINCPFDFLAHVPATIGKSWPPAAWFHKDKQETLDYAKYRSTPFNAAYQVYRLAKEIKTEPQPSCPLFFTLAASDVTVLSQVSIRYFHTNPNPKSRMVLYSNQTKHTHNDKRIIIRSSNYPKQRIRSFSHITIPIAPTNSHYGKNGDYPEASHIETNSAVIYGEHYLPPMNFHNFLYKHKLARYQYQRLSFNPDFAYLAEQIRQFIRDTSLSSHPADNL